MLEAKDVAVAEIVNAQKVPLTEDLAWDILSQGAQVVVAKGGKQILNFVPDDKNRAEILKVALGRSGKLRAPTIRLGDTFLVGFNQPLYEQLDNYLA